MPLSFTASPPEINTCPSFDGCSGVCLYFVLTGVCASSAGHYALWETVVFPHYVGHHTGVDGLWEI